ncbi:MAG: histidine kinase dimerization/phosphoacceptor domain -containing protein [Armatimonas sp.]
MTPSLAVPTDTTSLPRDTVLVLTRLPVDGRAIARQLEKAHIASALYSTVESFVQQLPQCLAGILTIEALSFTQIQLVKNALASQAPWSDVPLILLTGHSVPPQIQTYLSDLGNITVLERPLRPSSLLSVVESAARARRKQWEAEALLTHNASLNHQLQRAMMETHHRVKNNLQLMAAMVNLMAMKERPAESRDELNHLSTHIRGLALIHDLLTEDVKTRKDGTHLSVEAVLGRLLPLMQQTNSDRPIHFHIHDIQLPARYCTSLAIITNELVSNALKYSSQEVLVGFTVEHETACLQVEDKGKGFRRTSIRLWMATQA